MTRALVREGTYIRTLCEDLGLAIGTVGAHGRAPARSVGTVRALRKPARSKKSRPLPRRRLISPERVIPFPTIVLDGREAADFRAGRLVALPEGAAAKHVFVRDSARALVGVGEAVGALLAPRKVFV